MSEEKKTTGITVQQIEEAESLKAPLKPGTLVIVWSPFGHRLDDSQGTLIKKGFIVSGPKTGPEKTEKYEICLEGEHQNHRRYDRRDLYPREEAFQLCARIHKEFETKLAKIGKVA